MENYNIKIIYDFMFSLWPLVLIGCATFAICRCFKIHSDNKLKGGGFIMQYLPNAKDDPEIRQRIIAHMEKVEKAMEVKSV